MAERQVTVDGINEAMGVLLVNGTELWPITRWCDVDGEEVAPEEAVFVVAGSDQTGWTHAHLSDFVIAAVH